MNTIRTPYTCVIVVKLKTLSVRSSSRLGAPSRSFGPLGTDKVPGTFHLDATEPDGDEEGAAAPKLHGHEWGRDTPPVHVSSKPQGASAPGAPQADLKPKRCYKTTLVALISKWNCTQPKLFLC